MKTSDNFGLDVLVAFVNNVDHDTGWWWNIGILNEYSDEYCNYLFPSLKKIFGIHKNVMRIFLLEINFLKGRVRDSFPTTNTTNVW